MNWSTLLNQSELLDMRYLYCISIGGFFLFSVYAALLGFIPYLDYRYGLVTRNEFLIRLIKPTLLFSGGLLLCWIASKRLASLHSDPS